MPAIVRDSGAAEAARRFVFDNTRIAHVTSRQRLFQYARPGTDVDFRARFERAATRHATPALAQRPHFAYRDGSPAGIVRRHACAFAHFSSPSSTAMRRLPPLNALQIFATVARHRSFTRAADALCVTQGAISRQIQSLEAHYGFALFMRHARGLTLTVEGEQLLPVVVESFARIEDISLKLTRQRTDLALKVPTCVMRWVLPRIMRFQREHPDLHVQMTTTWRHDVDFQSEPFDAAIVYGMSPGPDVAAVPLFDERLTPVCAPDLLEGRPLARVEDLACHTLLHPTRDHRDWRRWLDYAGAAGVDPDRGPSFDSLDLATSAATQGFGVALGDLTLSEEDFAARRLAMPLDIVQRTGARYYFVYPESVAQQQKIQRFSAWLDANRD